MEAQEELDRRGVWPGQKRGLQMLSRRRPTRMGPLSMRRAFSAEPQMWGGVIPDPKINLSKDVGLLKFNKINNNFLRILSNSLCSRLHSCLQNICDLVNLTAAKQGWLIAFSCYSPLNRPTATTFPFHPHGPDFPESQILFWLSK